MENSGERPDAASLTERQPAVKLTTIVAAGLAGGLAAFFTSRFGITGTVLGTALTAMIITVGLALFGFYLERAAAKARSVLGGVRVRPPRRRSVLLGGLLAAAASFLVGMAAVTGVELGVGKNLSCWVWNECPTNDGGGRGAASEGTTRTRPSILGGGQKTIIFIPQPGGVEQHQQTAPRRGQEGPGSPYAPQGRPGGAVVRPEPREATQSSAALSQDAGPHQASGGWQPVQEGRPGGTPPDGQAPNERQSVAPDDSDQPVPSDEPHAYRPPAEQPVRQLPSIFQ